MEPLKPFEKWLYPSMVLWLAADSTANGTSTHRPRSTCTSGRTTRHKTVFIGMPRRLTSTNNDTRVIRCYSCAETASDRYCRKQATQRPDSHADRAFLVWRIEVAMPTFASTAPITEQVMRALIVLRHARRDGNASRIYVASEQLRRKLDALPAPARTLADIDPELDTRLRVSFA